MEASALGKEIRQYRVKNGLTQAEFGRLAGVGGKYPHVAVSDLETGLTQKPTARTLMKIRAVLDQQRKAEPPRDLEYYRDQIADLFKVPAERVEITIRV